jgi:hypothetical protein
MPSTSKKQHNFMEAVAHSPEFAKKAGVPQSVGKEFSKADKGKTFKRGGDMATNKSGKSKKMAMGGPANTMSAGAPMDPRKAAMLAKAMKARRSGMAQQPTPTVNAAPPQTQIPGMKKGGAVFTKAADGIAKRGKTKGTQVKMAMGGSTKKYC